MELVFGNKSCVIGIYDNRSDFDSNSDKEMSNDKIERILSTYEPVDGLEGYVWIKEGHTYIKKEILKEVYEEYLRNEGKD